MNYLQSFLEHVLTQPRNMFLWLTLLAMTARITTWRKVDKLRRRRELAEQQAERAEREHALQEYQEAEMV